MNQRRSLSALLTLAALVACNSGPSTAKEEVAELERRGVIPQLDRSSDVQGPDTDANGIRDDIDAYIATLPGAPDQKRATEQFARSMQTALMVNTSDSTALRQASTKISRAVQCISLRFPELEGRVSMVNAIESVTANTKERTVQYIRFNNALSGSVSKLLSEDTCEN